MNTKAVSLERHGLKRLLLTWEPRQRNLRLYLDGQLIRLDNHREAMLPDRSVITVGFNWLGQPLLYRNGRPLPGSAGDSARRIPVAAATCVIDGALWLLASLVDLSRVAPSTPNQPDSVGYTVASASSTTSVIQGIYLVGGLVLIICAVLIAQRKRSALWVALAIYGVDTLLTIIGFLSNIQNTGSWIGPAFHIGAMILMARAFAGFDLLDADEAELYMRQNPARSPLPGVAPSLYYQPPAKPLVLTAASSLYADAPALSQAEAEIRAGSPDRAKAILTDFMRDNPTNAYGWYLVSFIVSNTKDQIVALNRALQYNPGLSKAQTRLSVLEYEAQLNLNTQPDNDR